MDFRKYHITSLMPMAIQSETLIFAHLCFLQYLRYLLTKI